MKTQKDLRQIRVEIKDIKAHKTTSFNLYYTTSEEVFDLINEAVFKKTGAKIDLLDRHKYKNR